MTREDLEKLQIELIAAYVDTSYATVTYRDEVIKAFNHYRNACIHYGFEKARETKDTGEYMNDLPIVVNKYESVEQVIQELDKEQDDKR